MHVLDVDTRGLDDSSLGQRADAAEVLPDALRDQCLAAENGRLGRLGNISLRLPRLGGKWLRKGCCDSSFTKSEGAKSFPAKRKR